MNLLEIKAAVLQLSVAERSELVALLLQSLEQSPQVALEYARMTSLGIVKSDFDTVSISRDIKSVMLGKRPIGLRAQVGLSVESIEASLAPLSPDELEQWE